MLFVLSQNLKRMILYHMANVTKVSKLFSKTSMNCDSFPTANEPNKGILSKTQAAIITIVFLGLVGYLDYLTGIEISFSIFYLIPIVILTWYTSKRYGLLMAIVAAVIWYLNDAIQSPHYSHQLIPIWNAIARLGFFYIIIFSLCKIKSLLFIESIIARTDELTGLLNARAFYEYGDREIERARRLGLPLSMCYIDLDNFKQVNDTFGHSEGSKLIKMVGILIHDNIRSYDIAARLGGDEFSILLPQAGFDEAKSAISKLNENVLKGIKDGNWGVTLSIGVASYIAPPRKIEELIKKADTLMYDAKNKGKNQMTIEKVG